MDREHHFSFTEGFRRQRHTPSWRQSRASNGTTRAVLLLLIVAISLLGGAALWTKAQFSPGSTSPDAAPDAAAVQAALDALMHPAEVNAVVDAARTAEERAGMAQTSWDITHPGEHFQQAVQNDPAYLAQKAAADFAVLNPVAATALVQSHMTPETKAEHDRIADSIQNPVGNP